MNKKQKNNTLIGLLIAAIIFTVIKANGKDKKGVYVPEDGEFGEFGTDGQWDDEAALEEAEMENLMDKISLEGLDLKGTGFNPTSKLKSNADFLNFVPEKTVNGGSCSVC